MSGLDFIPNHGCQIGTVEAGDLLQTGWARNVDFRQVVTDYVNADENKPLIAQDGTNAPANFAVARRQSHLLRPAAHMHVAARLARGWHSIERTDGFPIDQDNALVALPHRRLVALDH